ncbi:MAG: hypothetical protein IKX85_06740, partial [Clostridia bacterium]|nr:hypothetical protein [Clostridia bacterium]
MIAAVLALAAVAVCLLTGPMRNGQTPDITLSDEVRLALEKAIPGQDPGAVSGNDESNFETSDYVVLGVEEKDNETTVYLWIYYATFVKDGDPTELGVKDDGETGQVIHVGKDGVIEKTGGSHVPTAVTLRKVAKGDAEEYVTAEFWEPRDGGYFTKDVKEKFPRALWNKALDSQWCVAEQAERCREKAEKWFAKGTLSLDEAIRLSEEKGENLTWGDFEAYRYTVTGSGMYIRLYRMEDDFSVWIGGTTNQPDPKDTPAYVYLFYGETWLDGPESASKSEWVDLRTGDVRAFVEKMKGETPPEDENGETDGLTALSPLEDWIAGTEPGPERDERLIALLRARSEYVKKTYLDGWYSPSAERATVTWKNGTVEISDPEKLRALAAVLAPEALRAAVDSPEIYKAAGGEGTLPSEEFQKAEMLYRGYGSVSNLLLDLHNGTVIGVLYDPGSDMETAELAVGRDGVFRKEDGSAEITPADGASFPFPTNHVCYLVDAKLLKVLEACLSDEPLPEELRAESEPQALSPLESEAAKEAALKKEVWEAEREKALVRYDELTREKEDFEKTHDMKQLTEAEGKAYSGICEELSQIRRDYISPEPQKTVNDQFLEELGLRIELYKELKYSWKKAGSETLDPETFGDFYEESAAVLLEINFLTVLEKRYLKGEDAGELLSAWRTVRISSVRFAEGTLQEEDWWDEVWNGGKLI